VVHRDVKPPNILVDLDDRIKLTDFGIASRSGDPKLTGAGIALGSLHYMSPEQMKAEALDARSDLYSLGVTLYEMVTGRTPVQGNNYYAILKAHLEDKPRSAAELAPELPPELSRIIDESFGKNALGPFPDGGGISSNVDRVRLGWLVGSGGAHDAERAGGLRSFAPTPHDAGSRNAGAHPRERGIHATRGDED
jgi:serine/threonine protein kinase